MKANELMIGDLLRVTKDVCIKKGTIVRVRAIDADDSLHKMGLKGAIRCQPIDDEYGMNIGGVWADFLEPIPLTAEILEKNGFIKDEDRGKEFGQTYHILIPTGYEAHSFTVQVTIYKEPIQGVDVLFKCWGWIPPFNGGLDDIHLCSLKYVHQIQHALRLCGIDKEIVL